MGGFYYMESQVTDRLCLSYPDSELFAFLSPELCELAGF